MEVAMSTSMSQTRKSRPAAWSLAPWLPRELFDFDHPFESLFGKVQDGMGDMLGTRLDVSETPNSFEIQMDLPGVKPEEVEISFENNLLTIRGERRDEREEGGKDKQFHRVERRFGSFSRSVMLPSTVNDTEAAAEFRDGVLRVVLPKSEQAKPRKISIK
jgi:HSP20 family protein